MRSRVETVRRIATDIKITAQVIALKRLAQETAAIYDELIRHRKVAEVRPINCNPTPRSSSDQSLFFFISLSASCTAFSRSSSMN